MTQNSNYETRQEAEETLRLLATLPPPAELTDRVHHRLGLGLGLGLAAEKAAVSRRGFWSLWMPAQRFQFAGAAVLVVAVAGSMWGVYRAHPRAAVQTRTQTGTQAAPLVPQSPAQGTAQGSFGAAKAERVPPTLHPIKEPPAPKKKPSASRVAKPSPKVVQPVVASSTP
jgi:hypothetical protein